MCWNTGDRGILMKNRPLQSSETCVTQFSQCIASLPLLHTGMGSDGSWKLCDFGSTSANHKCFEKPKKVGIEEDNIRKHTTPTYRALEMWDLFRREVINEKVDIWAIRCLLFRICYFISAFDGESKPQILNGLSKYS